MPAYWLFKSEPDVFSWEMLKARGKKGEAWDGVRNFQARNNMRAMKIGDLGFFYHSGEGKEVVGIMEVSRSPIPTPRTTPARGSASTCARWRRMPKPVTLAAVKDNPKLAKMVLVEEFAPVGAAGDGRGVGRGLPHGRPRSPRSSRE